MSNKFKKAAVALLGVLLSLLLGAVFGGILSWLYDNCLVLAIAISLGLFAALWYHYYKLD